MYTKMNITALQLFLILLVCHMHAFIMQFLTPYKEIAYGTNWWYALFIAKCVHAFACLTTPREG
jgi:hypothetical protein